VEGTPTSTIMRGVTLVL